MVEPLVSAGRLRVINVYIREAHPSDGWEVSSNASGETMEFSFGRKIKVCFTQTHSLKDRLEVANSFAAAIEGTPAADIPILVDDPATNALDKAYEAPPERMVVVQGGKVLFCTGQGPFQYSLKKLEAFLQQHYGKL